jgi:predicted phage tail protein
LAAGYDYFFWIRLVDTTGNVGAFYPATNQAGVHGQSSADASAILAYLTGQITQSQLGQDVLSPIQQIPLLQNSVAQLQAQYKPSPLAGDPNTYAGDITAYAGVYSEMTARAEADLALATKTDAVQAQLSTTSSNLTAMVNTETTARVTGDAANASAITTVQANLDTTNAAVQTNANAYADLNGRVSASYTIKTQITTGGRTYIAGIGIGIDNNSGTVESQVLVAAQRFAILDNTGSAVSSPFIVSGGQVFMSSAFIQDASITNAKISGVIQSNSVGANGQPRWVLDKNGVFTMNGANTGSGYLTITDSLVSVYDGNGTLRVRLGLW